jgi:TRAP transporter TAXI family solute receptor
MSTKIKLTLVLLAAVVLAGCGSPSDSAGGKTRLSIATGGTGGVYYPYGGGIAKVITEHIPNVEATAEVTAASIDNLKFLRNRTADIAFTMADTLADGVNGAGAFGGEKMPVRALAVLYKNYLQVVTLASGPIRTLEDLKGKVVSTGGPGSGTEVIAFRTLEAVGIDRTRDIRTQALGVSQSAEALKDGKIDAFFWVGGLPTASVLDLAHTPGIQIRLLSNESILPALQRYGESLYKAEEIPASVYPGVERVPVIWVANVLVVHEGMPEQLAYEITKALFEHKDDLVAIHPEANNLTLNTAVDGSTASFHPGAIRYYMEQNVWPQ